MLFCFEIASAKEINPLLFNLALDKFLIWGNNAWSQIHCQHFTGMATSQIANMIPLWNFLSLLYTISIALIILCPKFLLEQHFKLLFTVFNQFKCFIVEKKMNLPHSQQRAYSSIPAFALFTILILKKKNTAAKVEIGFLFCFFYDSKGLESLLAGSTCIRWQDGCSSKNSYLDLQIQEVDEANQEYMRHLDLRTCLPVTFFLCQHCIS